MKHVHLGIEALHSVGLIIGSPIIDCLVGIDLPSVSNVISIVVINQAYASILGFSAPIPSCAQKLGIIGLNVVYCIGLVVL